MCQCFDNNRKYIYFDIKLYIVCKACYVYGGCSHKRKLLPAMYFWQKNSSRCSNKDIFFTVQRMKRNSHIATVLITIIDADIQGIY